MRTITIVSLFVFGVFVLPVLVAFTGRAVCIKAIAPLVVGQDSVAQAVYCSGK